ncbi:hypothetical protein EDB85DRAFT_1890798 [Lactarius pseudohatsudake]|nr:hypothetical protein EDB85DRAFT_1890798 [Lactarius pseudohatsudake]
MSFLSVEPQSRVVLETRSNSPVAQIAIQLQIIAESYLAFFQERRRIEATCMWPTVVAEASAQQAFVDILDNDAIKPLRTLKETKDETRKRIEEDLWHGDCHKVSALLRGRREDSRVPGPTMSESEEGLDPPRLGLGSDLPGDDRKIDNSYGSHPAPTVKQIETNPPQASGPMMSKEAESKVETAAPSMKDETSPRIHAAAGGGPKVTGVPDTKVPTKGGVQKYKIWKKCTYHRNVEKDSHAVCKLVAEERRKSVVVVSKPSGGHWGLVSGMVSGSVCGSCRGWDDRQSATDANGEDTTTLVPFALE